ncbi:MAG: hypothetical protein DCF21_21355 [Leptolyngbya sp.]|jgi:putative membrane protein|nr:MAG: hypothetical protein DCF21_21355 [Leptolyngbya sp.]
MPYPPNVQEELARDRNHLAADRTLLSFIRGSLTLIGVGVAVEQIVSALSPGSPYIDEWAYGLSLVFIGVGVVSLVFAIADHRREMQRLKAREYRYTPRWSLATATGLAVFAIGALALGWLALSALG